MESLIAKLESLVERFERAQGNGVAGANTDSTPSGPASSGT